MANRQQAVPARVRAGAGENTARVVMHRGSVPGWFWGLLGFLSVLAIGFGALLFAAKNGLFAAAPVLPAAEPRQRPSSHPPSHPIKLARSPAPPPHAAVVATTAAKPAAPVAKA